MDLWRLPLTRALLRNVRSVTPPSAGSWTLRCARRSWYSTSYDKIAALVSESQKVSLIDNGNLSKNVDLASIPKDTRSRLQIVNIHPQAEGDPTVVVKVMRERASINEKRELKPKKPKPAKVKELQISWSISENDLNGQKRQAIESVLGRGHIVQVQLKRKRHTRAPLTPLELERREALVEKVQKILEELGELSKAPSGSINSQMVLYYRPRSE